MTGDDSGLSTVPWRSSVLYVILASSLVGVMGVSLISPLLPDLRGVFGISDAQVGLVITVYTLPGVFLAPFVGYVADRFGRRRVIVPLLVIFGVAGAAIAFVETFRAVLAFRFVQGIGASALVTLAVTLIGDIYDGSQRNAIMGLNGSVIGVGAAFYPVIGGALATIRWSLPFLFFGVSVGIGVVALYALRGLDIGASAGFREYAGQMSEVVVHPSALAAFAAVFSAIFVFYGAVLTALPLLMSDEFGLTSDQIGLLLAMTAVANAATASQYGRIAEWRSAPELIAIGFLAYGGSLLGLRFAPSPAFAGASLLLFGIGFGIVFPSADTTMVTLVPDRLRAGVMGVRTSAIRLGQTIGPATFTFAAERFFVTTAGGYRAQMLFFGACSVFAGVVGYAVLRRRLDAST